VEEIIMQEKIYKLIELVGTAETSMEDAIQNAIAHADQTLKNLDWFEVIQARGLIQEGKVSQYQVKLKIGFRLIS
jgi:flavin-binding protein dodecin